MKGDTNQGAIHGLRQALEHAPSNHALRLLLFEQLCAARDGAHAADELTVLLEADAIAPDQLVRVGNLAAELCLWNSVGRLLGRADSAGVVDGVANLRRRLDLALKQEGVLRLARPAPAGTEAPPASSEARVEKVALTFDDVGGLADVKKLIHRTIILPFRRPDVYRRYKKKAGGGVLLFGPPGCGKTLLARATAGECGLPFVNVRLEDILDPYFGVSESNLHDAFEEARARKPCVLFLDELDGLAYARDKHRGGGAGRTLVDQLLQELDAMGADNTDLLILAATNAPWDVDDALKRPGRFDRVVFVPPPDPDARQRILELAIADRPVGAVSPKQLARATPLFSGADLHALIERGYDELIEEALDDEDEPGLEQHHVEAVLGEMRPSTLDWLGRSRNYVEFANHNQRYDEVARFLKTREAKAYGKL